MQLSWKEGKALVYTMAELDSVGAFEYEGEGWGLCHDGTSLFMSDGSSTLTVRDPNSFEVTGSISVTRDGFSVRSLNELECVGDRIWANIYLTDRIVEIDKATGQRGGGIGRSCPLAGGTETRRRGSGLERDRPRSRPRATSS